MKKFYIGFVLIVALQPSLRANAPQKKHVRPVRLKEKGRRGRPFDTFSPDRANKFVGRIFHNTRDLWGKFASYDSLKVLSATLPFYLIGRRVDKVVHRQFYDFDNHKNRNQPPKFLCDLALDDKYISIPFVGLGLVGWLHHDPYERRRAQMFTTGMMWAFITKILVKEIKTDANLRPWNEHFSKDRRSYGGNPSGHMTITAYMATYWALEKGRRYGIPLGLYTVYAFGMNVACNHHYFSQAVAGTGLGVAMGIAAHAAFRDMTMPKNMSVGLGADSRGNLGIRFAYDF